MGRIKIKIQPGDIYEMLTIIEETHPHIAPSGRPHRQFKCKCVCGKEVEVFLFSLRMGKTKSCGCISSKAHTTHAQSNTLLYGVWANIKDRCLNNNSSKYKDYGGRGISVCEEWKIDFMAFYNWAMSNGYQKGLQIDRINNDGNYEPTNCRFVSSKINMRNRRPVQLNDKLVEEIKMLREKTGWGSYKISQKLNLKESLVNGVIYQNTWTK